MKMKVYCLGEKSLTSLKLLYISKPEPFRTYSSMFKTEIIP